MQKTSLLYKTLVIGIIFLFILMSIGSSTSHIGKGSFICKSNNPPYEPSNPYPENGATDISVHVILNWTGGDPDGDNLTYDIYFGNYTPPPMVLSNTSISKYDPPGLLEFCTKYYWKIVVWDEHGESTEGPIWSFTTRCNDPPNTPIPIYPLNGSTDIPICFNLKWNCSDPDGDDLTYDIYFGNTSPPNIIEHNWTGINYKFPISWPFEFNTTYYWKIVAWDEYGLNSTGGIWNFRTEPNYPPDPAHNPRPPNGAQNVPVDAILRWNGSDPNLCDTLKYDVYFGPNPNPPLVKSKISDNVFDPYGSGEMPMFQYFFWRIDTWDGEGLMIPGNEWTFTTGDCCAPEDPIIDGPSRWPVGEELCITISSSTPVNITIKYEIDWGDGDTEETSFYESGEPIDICHTYETKGMYIIRVRAIDEYGSMSDWSEFEVIIPRTRALSYLWFEWLFERFPLLERLLSFLLL